MKLVLVRGNSFRRSLVVSAVLLAALGLSVAVKNAPAKFSDYSYKDPDCTRGNTEDPTNVIWYARHYHPFDEFMPNSVVGYMNRLGWTNHGGGDAWLNTRSTRYGLHCISQASQNADDSSIANRNHLRIWDDGQNQVTGPGGTFYAASDAHHDVNVFGNTNCETDNVPAKHVSSTFNGARNTLASEIRHGGSLRRPISWVKRGNTRPQRQCDKSKVASDGNQLYVHLRSSD